MSGGEPRLLLDGLCFPEGPRFRNGELLFSDMHGHKVLAIDEDGGVRTLVNVPARPSGLGFLPNDDLLVVSMCDRKLLRLDGEVLHQHADLSAVATGHCNDMVVDGQGRAYVGNFGFDWEAGEQPKAARLALVTPAGQVCAVADGLMFPNGCVISPDGKTLIVAETFALRLTAFTIERDGRLCDRRVWAELDIPPDGICLDAEGCVWVANPRSPGGFIRVAEGGEVRERIELADRAGFACMLGGRERRSLYLLEAFSAEPARATAGNGRIRGLEVEVPGAGWP